ncbi:serine/threonine protein kinase [Actinomadura sp. GC306]|uniref:serine/threonine-protein kinase n=1 Tax=Actinomadura sp. GC306 TaxID=2530367 RepID=UPI0010507AAD|nr:serine/threonine-protein kinase [Actinomadura sp. GC306]TDC64888.1 serine/threonine protein kinase [Actinomadura sp. GC306]
MRSGLVLAGRYELEEMLGRGGMGEVWRGVDQRLRRPVAVKILPLSGAADGTGLARFRREAEIAAAVNHPGLTTVFDIDEHTDGGLRLFFQVMELMRGRDLASVLSASPSGLPVAQVVDWAVQILDALTAAHGQGVVHRDIKPANLFLTDDGRVKVCDFGISRLADATRITATGAAAGTPLYMAPEQIEGHAVDERTDLYAFGCVLYHLLTGTTWVDAGSGIGSVLHQHLNRAPAPPRSLRPDIDERLSALVLDLLAKSPDDRPKDAATVAAHLRALDSSASSASRTPPTGHTRPTKDPGGAQPDRTAPTRPYEEAPPARPGDQGGGTATAAMILTLLGLPGLLAIAFMAAVSMGSGAPIVVIVVNLVVVIAEAVLLAIGTRRLSQRMETGRRMIAIVGGLAALHLIGASLQFILIGGDVELDSPFHVTLFVFCPLAALLLIAAVVMALLPATARWCRPSEDPH